MKRWMKVLLGLGTHWFLTFIPFMLVMIFAFIAAFPKANHGDPPPGLVLVLITFVLIHLFSIFVMLVTEAFFKTFTPRAARTRMANVMTCMEWPS